MNLDHIRQRAINGFKPFVIQLSNGWTFDVPHPEFLTLSRNVVGVLGENDVITTIDALHIVSIEDLPVRGRK